MRIRALAAAVLIGVAVTSCNDATRLPTAPTAAGSPAAFSTGSTSDHIGALIDSIFSKGDAQAAHSRWDDVTRQLTRGAGPSNAAKSQYVNLVRWIQGKTGAMTAPSGETAAHVAARLVLYMSVYVYGGADVQPPPMTATSDAVLGVVDPTSTAPTLVQTPTQHAAVQFPAGAVAEPTVVVITLDPTAYPDNCSGPLVTHLCQYPQFYKFNVFPDVRLQKAAGVAVCHVDAGSNRRPLADHDRFRLAHDRPVNSADYAPNSTIVDSIEILDLHFFAGMLNCTGTSYGLARPTSGPGLSPLDRWLNRGLNVASRLASAVGSLISPRSAYAIDQGGGGFVLEFSTFTDVDPNSAPDLAMTSPMLVSPLTVYPSDTIRIGSWTYTNSGTGTSPTSAAALVLATDTALSANVVTLSTYGADSPMPPQQTSVTVPAQKIVLPAGTPAGTYYLGAKLDPANGAAESNETNNYLSTRIELRVLRTSMRVCPTETPTSTTVPTIAQALPVLADGGTLSLCDGTHVAYDVPITRAMTIKSAGPGIATINADTAQQALQLGGGTGAVTLHRLKFTNGVNASVDVSGAYGSIVIDSSEFDPASGTGTAHAGVNIANAAGAGIMLRANAFVNGDVGVRVAGGGVTIRRSTFSGQANAGVLVGDAAAPGTLVVDSSAFAACARVSCVRATGASAASLTFAADTFRVDIAHQVGYAIRDSMPHGTLTVNDNVITGTGNTGTDPTVLASYPVDSGAIRVSGNASLSRNHITNVARGFLFLDDGINATGSDNVTQHVVNMFREFLPSSASLTVKFNRNDFADYVSIISGSVTAASALDFRCNYWGGPAPHNAAHPSSGTFQYTPWSAQPIANTTVACDPSTPFTTIRACPSGTSTAPTVATLGDAFAVVPDNGTVLVCDGTQSVAGTTINHGLTVKAEGPGTPTLDGGTANSSIIFVNSTAQAVTIQGLTFTGSKQPQVSIGTNYTGTITIDNDEFHPFQSFPYGSSTTATVAGVLATGTFGTMNVTNSRFIGGDVGVQMTAVVTSNGTSTAGAGGAVTVRNNIFSGQTNIGLLWSTGGANAFVSNVGATLHAENNTFDHCGLSSCARVNSMTGGHSEWIGNHFAADISRPTQNGIQLLAGGGATVDHNDFTGTGNGSSSDRTQPSVYPFTIDAILVQNQAATVTNNTATNVWAGIMLVTNGSTTAAVTGDHNTVTHSAYPFVSGSSTPSTLVWQKNDFVDYVAPTNSPGSLPAADVRCSWWGSTAGPQNPPTSGSIKYLPWSSTPIANNPSASCDPSQTVTTIRVCPTPASDGTPTTSSVANAYVLVPAGGTISVCDGTYPVTQTIFVQKSVTITGEGTAMPTLDGGGAGTNQSIIGVFNTNASVTLRQLRFQNATGHDVQLGTTTGPVVIDHAEFHPKQTYAYNAVYDPASYHEDYWAGVGAFGGVSSLLVTNSQFIGGDIGIHVNPSPTTGVGNIQVKGSHFTGQSNAGFFVGGGSPGLTTRVEADTFDVCGRIGCTKFYANNGGRAEFVNSSFNVDIAHPVNNVITVDGRNPISLLIDNNRIIGTGGGGDRTQKASYPIDGSAIGGTAPTATISHNTISNAWLAISTNSGTTTATDNVVSHVYTLVGGSGATPITFALNRSDLSDYTQVTFGTNGYASMDLRCNYWGSSNGPSNPGNFVNPAPQYLPWSNVPIANTTVACNPSASTSTIRVCATPATDGSMTTNTLMNAYLLVPAGGTISVCDGTYPVTQTIFVQKSVTITGEGTAMPTLDGGGAGTNQSIIGVFNTNANVTLRQLRFQNATGHDVQFGTTTGALLIDHAEFHPKQTYAYDPVFVPSAYHEDYWAGVGAFGGVSSLLVTNSQFIGGDIGIHINTSNSSEASSIVARGNHFTGQSNAGFFVGGSTPSLTARAEADTFDICGRVGCTKFFAAGGGRGEWVSNRFNIDISHPVQNVILTAPGGASTPTFSTLIDHNVITGTGGGGDRTVQATYPVDGVAIAGTGQTSTITSNTVTNVWTAINATGTTTASDNVFSHVYTLVGAGGPSSPITLAFNRSDLSDYTQVTFGTGGFASMDLRCNYWGAVTGPTNPGNFINPSPQYLPWSTVPIANNPSVSCNPSVATTTLRVCPTASSTDPLTSLDANTAYSLLPAGGTMRFCDGTHTTSLWVTKPMTFTSDGPGIATLVAAPAAANALGIGNANGVTISNLKFQGGVYSNIAVNSATGPVLIDKVQFTPTQTQPYGSSTAGYFSGVFIAGQNTAPITVQNSTFTGGDVGVNWDQASNVTIRNNTFAGQTNAGTTGGNGTSSNVLIDNNAYSDCGLNSCISAFNVNGVTVSNNHLTIASARPTQTPINLFMNAAGAATVTGNVLSATGATGSFSVPSSFPIQSAIQVSNGAAAVNGNQVTNAWQGIVFANLSGSGGSASDNVLNHVNAPFTAFGAIGSSTTGAFTRNDVTDYSTEIFNPGAFQSLNLRCNWWGSASGPANTAGLPAATFTPYATTPIAGTSVSCGP